MPANNTEPEVIAETTKLVVEAVPDTVRAVVDAYGMVEARPSPLILVNEVLPTTIVEEALSVPETVKGPPIDDEALEMKPPVKVESPKAFKVPVAVIFEAVKSSLKNPEPATESLAKGEVVPIPTIPPSVANHAPPFVVREVDEA